MTHVDRIGTSPARRVPARADRGPPHPPERDRAGVYGTLAVAGAILAGASLNDLGMGARPQLPSGA